MLHTGKYLIDLEQDVMVSRKPLITVHDDLACINWCSDETLAFFDPADGYPLDYWLEGHPYPDDNRDEYTDFSRFVTRLKVFCKNSPDLLALISSPVWRVGDAISKDVRPSYLRLVK